jgi:hypothetical protein
MRFPQKNGSGKHGAHDCGYDASPEQTPISQTMCLAKASTSWLRSRQTVVKLRSKRGVSPHRQLAPRNWL